VGLESFLNPSIGTILVKGEPGTGKTLLGLELLRVLSTLWDTAAGFFLTVSRQLDRAGKNVRTPEFLLTSVRPSIPAVLLSPVSKKHFR
jgi:hypothetical protein